MNATTNPWTGRRFEDVAESGWDGYIGHLHYWITPTTDEEEEE